jgi:hypothetical protein
MAIIQQWDVGTEVVFSLAIHLLIVSWMTTFYGIVIWSCHFLGPVVGTKLWLNFSQHAVFGAPGHKIDGQIWDRSKGRND